jgi:carbon-monoxide dehydrogenase small subunit
VRDQDLELSLDGIDVRATVDPGLPLLDVLRDVFAKTGTHAGCRNGDCGACTVLIDGEPYKSCLVPTGRVQHRTIETIQGLAGPNGELTAVQQAMWDHTAFQCGFCLAGPVLCATALARRGGSIAAADIEQALRGNLCRCTGYQQMRTALIAAIGHPDKSTKPTGAQPHDQGEATK